MKASRKLNLFLSLLLVFTLVFGPIEGVFAQDNELSDAILDTQVLPESEETPEESLDTDEVVEEATIEENEIFEDSENQVEDSTEIKENSSEEEIKTDEETSTEIENNEVNEETSKEAEDAPLIEESNTESEKDSTENNEVKISVIYMNDVHGRINYSEGSQIGYAKIKSYYDSIEGNKLLFDVGDSSQGTIEVNLKQGQPSFEIMDLMGVDASVLGNHEFDFSYDALKNNISLFSENRILGSNIVSEDGSRPYDNVLIREFDGIKVGIFGVDTPETKYKAKPSNTSGLTFEKPVEIARQKVRELKTQGVDVIIALTHLGVDGSTVEDERATYLLENVDGIDLLLDGHSHTIGSRKIGNGYYAQAAKYSELLGEATLTIDKDTKEVSISNQFHHVYTPEVFEENKSNDYYTDFYTHVGKDLRDIEEDATIKGYIDNLSSEIEPLKAEVIGHTNVKLEGTREEVRTRQTNLSTIIANAMRDAAIEALPQDSGFTAEDVVTLTNGGGIRDSILVQAEGKEDGAITKGEVLTVLPFGNTVTVIEVTGQQIYEALKFGTDAYPDTKGAYPQVAGMTFDIYVNEEGKAIDVGNILISGKPIDLNKTYVLATNDFIAVGGDGYTMFEGAHQITLLEGMAEIVMDYITDYGTIDLKDEDIDITKVLEKPVEDPEKPSETPENPSETDKTDKTDETEKEKTTDKPSNNKEDAKVTNKKNNIKNPKTSDPGIAIYAIITLTASGAYVYTNKKNK